MCARTPMGLAGRYAAILVHSMLVSLFALLLQQPVHAEERRTAASAGQLPDGARTALELAAQIDRLLAKVWANEGVVPAPPATDAAFVRRAYLDLAGKIPPAGAARALIDNPDPDKRRALIDRLLARGTYAAQLARTWRALLVPDAELDRQTGQFILPFESWLKVRFVHNTPYDLLVRELLTAGTVRPAEQPELTRPQRAGSPTAFFVANQGRPENIAASASEVFLGLQLRCAQCHDHPFSHWRQAQFWELAAFFAPESRDDQAGPLPIRVGIPDTDEQVGPRFLDGTEPDWGPSADSREVLARWMTSPENPYFARALADRVWGHLFGAPLVDPLEDLSQADAGRHAALLDELAEQLILHQFDVKYLIRSITYSEAYQRSSRLTHPSQQEVRWFARMPVRSMTAEQLFDSLVQATGLETREPRARNLVLADLETARARFLQRFADAGPTRTDYEPSVLQALTLMNGELVGQATSVTQSGTLQAVLDAPFLDTDQRIEALYVAALSRTPAADEAAEMRAVADAAATGAQREEALSNIFWALLNSAEFVLIH